MENKNIIASISYLEFVNNITALINKLLYSPEEGYINYTSKDAIISFKNIVKKFDNEVLKLSRDLNYSDIETLIKSKKKDLILAIQKHYDNELFVWADEVFDNLVDNCLFEVSINKQKANEYYNQLACAVGWLCDIKNSSKEEYCAILKEYTKRFNSVLKTNDNDYVSNQIPNKTDFSEFVRIWNMILDDCNAFIEIDFIELSTKFVREDLTYFENIKNKLSTYKKINIIDELTLISTAIENMQLKKDEDIYNFIKQIDYDFIGFIEQNKKITENDKVVLINRRSQIFSDKNKSAKNYFKKLLTSLNE